MFKSRKALIAENKLLQERLETLLAAAQKIQQSAILTEITREGKLNKFIFVRNGQLYVIETYGTLDDDISGWRKALL